MKQPIFVRPLSGEERQSIEASLRSSDAFLLRRSQMLLASARGERVPTIARALSCNQQTVRNAIHAFNQKGEDSLQAGSRRPPRDFGFETGLWTLSPVATLCVKQGWTKIEVSSETIRQTLKRLGINWKRAKHWITSPDPLYFKKKRHATA